MSIIIINNEPESLIYFEELGFQTICCNVEEIIQNPFKDKPTYFVSPSNSLLFMDGGIDKSYMQMFPGIQQLVQRKMINSTRTPTSLLGRKYLPIGAALSHKISDDYTLICAPTMLLPQNITGTRNAYHAMKAILKVWPCDGNLLVPMLGCGCGKLSYQAAAEQMHEAISEPRKYSNFEDLYVPTLLEQSKINLEQPKYYSNTEFFDIDHTKLVYHPNAIKVEFTNDMGHLVGHLIDSSGNHLDWLKYPVPGKLWDLIKPNTADYLDRHGCMHYNFKEKRKSYVIDNIIHDVTFN